MDKKMKKKKKMVLDPTLTNIYFCERWSTYKRVFFFQQDRSPGLWLPFIMNLHPFAITFPFKLIPTRVNVSCAKSVSPFLWETREIIDVENVDVVQKVQDSEK